VELALQLCAVETMRLLDREGIVLSDEQLHVMFDLGDDPKAGAK
jgi:hypothetical protein